MTLDHIIPHTFHCIFETISGNYRDREGEKLGDRELRGRTLPAVFRRERQRRGRRRRGGVRAGDNTVGEDTVVRGGGGGAPASGVVGEERQRRGLLKRSVSVGGCQRMRGTGVNGCRRRGGA
jgi:hypothetical protein